MPDQFTRADALREYLTGALIDGGTQTDPNKSLGGYRSTTEAVSLGIQVTNPITGVAPLYAGGANPIGDGSLATLDANHMAWKPAGSSVYGAPAFFSGTNDIRIVEADGQPGQYLRVRGTTPFSVNEEIITLDYLMNNVFGMDDISALDSTSTLNEYRATIVRNEGSSPISSFRRWIGQLGTQQVSNVAFLSGTGSGVISTSGTFVDWPSSGWCQVRDSGGTLKEVVYYASRTNSNLNVAAASRGLLGTSSTSGSLTDTLYSVPGVAIAMDTAGVQTSGLSIQSIVDRFTAPVSVSWNVEVLSAGGLNIGTLNPNQQIGIWIWRQTPPGVFSSPSTLNKYLDSFNAF